MTEVRDATRFGSASLQAKTEYDRAQGSEDCLYLNVYRPAVADGAPLPVMMSGFTAGASSTAPETRFTAPSWHRPQTPSWLR